MKQGIKEILQKDIFSPADLKRLLSASEADRLLILQQAALVKEKYIGNKVYFRGLIEISNRCAKNCYYCGIRSGNRNVSRYAITEAEALDAARYAFTHHFGSIVIQGGELNNKKNTANITGLLRKIKTLSNNNLGITLSLGEQSEETYREWFNAGAHRYLLRIETSNRELYYKLHPENSKHNYDNRLKCLETLKTIGYNVGTGVMIGLPFQTMEDLAGDLLFFKSRDIDMVGMGPYIEHENTPLYKYKDLLLPLSQRFQLSLTMVALLRIMMKDVNIAATTAMQTIDPQGREKALKAGANVIMPNLTPLQYREGYLLYKNKPGTKEDSDEMMRRLEKEIIAAGCSMGYGEWGDSLHFKNRKSKT